MGAPPPTPPLSLHSTALLDLHVDPSHAVPPVMSTLDPAPRPTRPRPLYPALPKLKPATVADVDPDDGPLLAPPTELIATFSS